MISVARVRALRQVISGPVFRWRYDLTLAFLMALWVGGGSSWDGDTIRMWGRVVPAYPKGIGEPRTASFLLLDTISTYFLFLIVPLMSRVLNTIPRSFTLNQTLWIRLSPSAPIELALARILVCTEASLWMAVNIAVLPLVVAIKHPVAWKEVLAAPVGMFGYAVMAGGIAHLLGFILRSRPRQLAVAGITAMGLPLLGYALYETVLFNAGYHWARYYPTYFPFITDLGVTNGLSMTLLGLLLHAVPVLYYCELD